MNYREVVKNFKKFCEDNKIYGPYMLLICQELADRNQFDKLSDEDFEVVVNFVWDFWKTYDWPIAEIIDALQGHFEGEKGLAKMIHQMKDEYNKLEDNLEIWLAEYDE